MESIDLKRLEIEERDETEAMIAELTGGMSDKSDGGTVTWQGRFIANGQKSAPEGRWAWRFIASGAKRAPAPRWSRRFIASGQKPAQKR